MNKYLALLLLLLVGVLLVMVGLNWIAYSAEQNADAGMIGSEAWCDGLLDKPADKWTDRESKDFANHCLNP